ncbi:AAA family ATPase [Streptomyces sp. DSM 44938]|uniref:AAA family ATPase n=2 Tax=Streptomyces litchfieldiae TaxID=3075543 RepID=A0ABU2MVX0_9ACTN|nr:AAA family ATPase [Streptomyces sp. DSM 44938]MDT0345782.1 AAA family ATPase [Streptomyces sp. DSM 44938]
MVSGPPGSGKSSLARRLGEETCLPVISRDAVKAGICFTSGGVPDDIAARAAEAFWSTLRDLSGAGVSLVAEWALRRGRAEERLAALDAVAEVRLVICRAPREVLERRVRDRLAEGPHRRWPFPDAAVLAGLRDGSLAPAEFEGLDAPFPAHTVDTGDDGPPSLDRLLAFLAGDG